MRLFNLFIFFSFCFTFNLAGYSSYIVPEPTIEAFSPKGLRISIPDEPGIEIFAIHANLNKPMRQLESGDMSTDVTQADHGHWIYWNSEVSVKPGDTLYYWILVQKYGKGYRKDNGRYYFDKVTTLPDREPDVVEDDCEDGTAFVKMGVPFMHGWDNMQSVGQKSSTYKSSSSSSYSTNSKPIVRSSSSTIKGTYVVKPSGVEGTGFHESSSFDSTKPDGYQWQHTRKDLTAEDLLKQPELNHLKLRELTNSGSQILPDLPKNTAAVHTSSYYKKQVTSSDHTLPSNPQPLHLSNEYQSRTSTFPEAKAQQYQHSYFQQSSRQMKQPVVVPAAQVYKEESSYTRTSSNPNRIHVSVRPGEPIQIPISAHVSQVSNERESVQRHTNTHSSQISTDQGQRPVDVSYERRGQYVGSVFEITSNQPYRPEDCKRYVEAGSDMNLDVRSGRNSDWYDQLSREIAELRCLSSLMESVLRGEIRTQRQQYDELTRKFQGLEAQVRRFEDTCECTRAV